MEKYKHVKLGITAKWNEKHELYQTDIDHATIQYLNKELVQNSNDWEEVKEEPKYHYLITAFRFKDSKCIWYLKKDGSYGANPIISKYTLNEMLKGYVSVETNDVQIYSVKNSKGEEFTIGEVAMYEKEKFTISKFGIYPYAKDIIMASFKETNTKLNNLSGSNIEFINKYKTPIFVSADGKDMFEGDSYYIVIKSSMIIEKLTVHISSGKVDHVYFSTKELAQEYIDNNKPKYSLADIEKAFTDSHYSPLYIGFKVNLKSLGK